MPEEAERKTRRTRGRKSGGKPSTDKEKEAPKRRARKKESKAAKAEGKARKGVSAKRRRRVKAEKKAEEEEKPPVKPPRAPPEPAVGVLLNYQLGPGVQRSRYGLIRLEGVYGSGQAAAYIGRTVILHYNEKTAVKGQVVGLHGRGGVLRVRFRRGLNPEAIAKSVTVH